MLKQKQWVEGVKSSTPVVLGYIPIGLAFGVLAFQQGLSIKEIFLMSVLVYAGSSQFIAVSMIGMGVSPLSIIFTTFFVNLRHLLMSASLAPHVKHISQGRLAAIAFGITDETFAVGITRAEKEKKSTSYFLALHIISQAAWIISTVAGGLVGNLIPNPEKLGLDYALPAMFIGLLVMQIKDNRYIKIAALSGLMSVILSIYIKGSVNIIIATVIAATMGVAIEAWTKK